MAGSFGLSDLGVRFSPMPLRGGEGSGAASAAGLNPFVSHLANNMAVAPKYDDMADTHLQAQSAIRQQVHASEGAAVAAGLQSYGQTAGSELRRRGMVESAEIGKQASDNRAMWGFAGNIATAGLKLMSGGLA